MHNLKALLINKSIDNMRPSQLPDPEAAMACSQVLASSPSQDNYCIRFLRRKANCIFLLIMLLISLLSVLQIFMTKVDDKVVTSLTTTLLEVLKESDILNTTHLFTNENVSE